MKNIRYQLKKVLSRSTLGEYRRYLEKRVGAYGKLRGCQVGQLIFFFFFLNGKSVLSINSCFVAFLML